MKSFLIMLMKLRNWQTCEIIFVTRISYLEMSYTSDECVKCFIGGSRFDFDNEKGSEDETMRIYDDKENEVIKENWEQEEQANRQ